MVLFGISAFILTASYLNVFNACQNLTLGSGLYEGGFRRSLRILCAQDIAANIFGWYWVVFGALRIWFIQKYQTDFFLKFEGIAFKKPNKVALSYKDAAYYHLLEWLPIHISVIYVLVWPINLNMFTMTAISSFMMTAQIIWLAPHILRYKDKNIFEALVDIELVAQEKAVRRFEKFEKTPLRRGAMRFTYFMSYTVFLLILGIYSFLSVQLLRLPALDDRYLPLVYEEAAPVWSDNMYFALEGVFAPADVEDFRNYGFQKALARFMFYEDLKQLSGIPYTYDAPRERFDTEIVRPREELRINSDQWAELRCLYKLDSVSHRSCASVEEFQTYIDQNRIVWDRFNNVYDDGFQYDAPPQSMRIRSQGLLKLVELKATDIVLRARMGKGKEATEEWIKYMKLYRMMGQDRSGNIQKAVVVSIFGVHMNALRSLFLASPEKIKAYDQKLRSVLSYDQNLFRNEFLLLDSMSSNEPVFTGLFGNANLYRNEFLDCHTAYYARAIYPYYKMPTQDFNVDEACQSSLGTTILGVSIPYDIFRAGALSINIVYQSIFSRFMGEDNLLWSMEIREIEFDLARTALRIVSEGMSETQIVSYLAQENAKQGRERYLYQWDRDLKAIYFEDASALNRKILFRVRVPEGGS